MQQRYSTSLFAATAAFLLACGGSQSRAQTPVTGTPPVEPPAETPGSIPPTTPNSEPNSIPPASPTAGPGNPTAPGNTLPPTTPGTPSSVTSSNDPLQFDRLAMVDRAQILPSTGGSIFGTGGANSGVGGINIGLGGALPR